MPSEAVSAEAPRAVSGLLLGHPRALGFLAGTEFWDRVSFYGMQSLLTLYLVEQLLLPGHVENVVGFSGFRAAIEALTGPLSTQALASQICGVYVGFLLFAPILGGAIGDRWLGRTRSVALGAILMTFGHLAMAFDQSFLLAMLLIIVGTGFLRGNLAPQVGDLYDREDRNRTVAFQIYGAAINGGALLAPIVTGALAQQASWHAGFAVGAIGMLIGLVTYLSGLRHLPAPAKRRATPQRQPLTREEWIRVGLLVSFVPLAATFWIAQSQTWNTYNIWVRDHLQLSIAGFQVPVPWLQSIDGLAPILTLPPMLAIWRWQHLRGNEPDEFGKLAIGCFIFAGSTLWLAAGQFVIDGTGRTPFLWAVGFHIFSNLGWLYFAPTLNALFSRAAPIGVTATMMGLYSVSGSLAAFVSGRLGGFYEAMTPAAFWTLHAAVVGAGGVLILLFSAAFRQRLFGAPTATARSRDSGCISRSKA